MFLILLGAPASGKGTQAEKIKARYNLTHISTGEIFRREIKDNTPLGNLAASYIDDGKLVPDSVVIEIVENRIKKDDCKQGFLLDGFPRTLKQAKVLDQLIQNVFALNLFVEENELIRRISGRRVCFNCGRGYDISVGQKTLCDCGGQLIKRDDDNQRVFQNRLDIYHIQTEPLINYYKSNNRLIVIDGSQTPQTVFELITTALEKIR